MIQAAATTQILDFALHMATLLQSTRAMYQAHNSPDARGVFEKHLLLLITDLVPADSGAVLVEDYVSRQCIVPPAFIERILKQRNAFAATENGRHAVVAPLQVRKEVAGMLYLERENPPFEEEHVLMLTSIANCASIAIEGAYQEEWLESEVKRLERDLYLDEDIAGESPKIRDLCEKIRRIAPTAATVLILGESGTGKELVARSLHRNSPRAANPFVAINCAALSETLLESELFGHEKGAFTGAILQKRGRLECGEGGTVFLDEIGEMPLLLQAKLLRVLQAREFERVGGTRTIPLNIRLIAATNRNLEEATRRGQFREDLFYRLNVVSLRTPPLRERSEDIVLLATRFAGRFGEKSGRRIKGISPDARSLLRSYAWPGNVRELENAIEHAVVLGSTDMIRSEDLPESVREARSAVAPESVSHLQDAVNTAKRAAVQRAFEQAKFEHNEAAKLLGVHPNYLYRLIRNMEMQGLLRNVERD